MVKVALVVSIIALAVCLLTALHGVLSDGLKGLKQRSKSIGISFLIYAVAFLLFILLSSLRILVPHHTELYDGQQPQRQGHHKAERRRVAELAGAECLIVHPGEQRIGLVGRLAAGDHLDGSKHIEAANGQLDQGE